MEVDIIPKYSFIPYPEKIYHGINDTKTKNLFEKWGINFHIQQFSFNEPFHQYHKYHLAEAFFKDVNVAKNLKIWINNSFQLQGSVATEIHVEQIPCSIMTMSFFDKLKDIKNNIVYNTGTIRQRFYTEINGIIVADNLRGMLIDEECDEFNLYSKYEREEFIFRLFQLLVLGGEYCQYEDHLNSYLDVTKTLYKDLINVEQNQDNDTFISTIVLKVVAKNNTAYFPKNPNHLQNVGFLLVNGTNRLITTFLHQYNGY